LHGQRWHLPLAKLIFLRKSIHAARLQVGVNRRHKVTTPFIGEIQLFAFSFAPPNWAHCDGKLLPISQFIRVYSLIGTTYGGNGKDNFLLPNFVNRGPCGPGAGTDLTSRTIGDVFGENAVTLTSEQMPAHTHALTMFNQTDIAKRKSMPAAGNTLEVATVAKPFATGGKADTPFASSTVGMAGGGQAHENRQPFLAVNFCIALDGAYPVFS
jgi:microcystin-dependent protein